jgi:hypothetical protein
MKGGNAMHNKSGVVKKYGRRWKRNDYEREDFKKVPKYRGKRAGLYILYKGKKIVYVGRSEKNIRLRLVGHTRDRIKDNWDSFSWFITSGKYAADLEALLFNIFWDVVQIKESINKASFIKAEKCRPVRKNP